MHRRPPKIPKEDALRFMRLISSLGAMMVAIPVDAQAITLTSGESAAINKWRFIMSETEFWVGKVTKLIPQDGETTEQMCERLLCGETSYGDTFVEKLCDKFYKKYISHNGDVYDLTQAKNIEEYGHLCKATRNQDGSIEIALRFYNGGTCLSEMFEEAMNKLEI